MSTDVWFFAFYQLVIPLPFVYTPPLNNLLTFVRSSELRFARWSEIAKTDLCGHGFRTLACSELNQVSGLKMWLNFK